MIIRHFQNHADRAQCVELQELTWGRGFTEKVPAAMLLVAQETGGVAAGAYAEDGTLLGFVFGVTGLRNGKLAHWSDMLAVRPEAQGQRLGERLKSYQRDHCRSIGVHTIYWTYDPLVARNAHLNLNRMGARVDEFVAAMYGEGTNSPLQGDMPTDRFIVSWPVNPAESAVALDALPPDVAVVVDSDASEQPLAMSANVGVRIPRDITALAAADIAAARRWRFATRRAFAHYLTRGYHVRGFVADEAGGTYLLVRRQEP
ncbi:MAG: GNAT family N-acetyltransferase [Gemmatimonadaceae bacterium]|nr:GNAT family N-acetyltransferase [Gemmatimonadaceae bacterium]